MKHIDLYAKRGRAAFMASPETQDAIMWNLELMALAARRVSDTVRFSHPQVPWDRMCHICRGLVDERLSPDLEKAWELVQGDLPGLMHEVKMVLNAKITKNR